MSFRIFYPFEANMIQYIVREVLDNLPNKVSFYFYQS